MAPHVKITNKEFLEALAGKDWTRVPIAWGADTWDARFAGKYIDKLEPEDSNYYTVSIFNSPPGRRALRRKELWLYQFAFVIDDVGTKINEDVVRAVMPPATYELETSPGNRQFGYKLVDATDARVMDALVDAIVSDPEINPSGRDPGMKGLTRIVRLPVGSNNKPQWKDAQGKGWPHVLHVWEPERAYSVAELASPVYLGVDLGEEALARFKGAGGTRKATAEEIDADPLMALFDMRGMLLDPNPNDNGFVTVRCPWAEEHSDSREEAGYRPGRRGFQCHHGHCESRGMGELMAWAVETMTAEERATAFGEVWPEIPDDDPRLAAAEKAAVVAETAKVDAVKKERAERQEEAKTKAAPIIPRWTVVEQLSRFGNTDDGHLYTEKEFNMMNTRVVEYGSSGKNTAAALFLNSGGAVRCKTATYYPGKPAIFEDHRDGRNIFNRWRPGTLRPWPFPVSSEDIQPWLDHAEYILPDPVALSMFLKWCAFVTQRPGAKINWAYFLIGGQGIGKDTLLTPIWGIIGPENVATLDPRKIESDFNEWAEHQIVVLEELPSFHKQDVYDYLKRYVATGMSEFWVNNKNEKPYRIPNLQNWFIFSNHEDALKLEEDDRRYFVYNSPAKKKEDPAYYTALRDQGNGLFEDPTFQSKLYAWLLDYDLSQFNPGEAPPMTDAKKRMLEETKHPVDRWLDNQFDGGKYDGRKLIQIHEVLADAQAGGRHNGLAKDVERGLNEQKIGRWLRKNGWRAMAQRRLPSGGKVRLWVAPKESIELLEQLPPVALELKYTKDAGLPTTAAGGAERGEESENPF